MAYHGSIQLDDEARIETLEQLSNEEDSKRDVWRGLIDAAAAAQDGGLVDDDQTTIEALDELLDTVTTDSGSNNDLPEILQTRDWRDLGVDHDVSVPLDAINPNDIKATHKDRIPAIVAVLNHEYDRDEVEENELKSLLRDMFELSDSSIRNYMERLINQGVIYPDPSIDPEIWSRSEQTDLRLRVAGEETFCDRLSDLPESKELYAEEPLTKILAPRGAYEHFVSGDSVYLSEDAYRDAVWGLLSATVRTLSETSRTGTTYNAKIDNPDRAKAWFSLLRKVVNVTSSRGVWTDDESEVLSTMVQRAYASNGSDAARDEVDELVDVFNMSMMGVPVDAAQDLDIDTSTEMSVEEARDVLDVDGSASNVEIESEARDRVAEVYDGDSDEYALKKVEQVVAAKTVLTA